MTSPAKWHVSTLLACKQCHAPIDRIKNNRLRSYCSKICRDRFLNAKSAPARALLQIKRMDAQAIDDCTRKQCAYCSRWYRRVLRHAQQRHGITAVEYKRDQGLAVGVGILPEDARETMRAHTLANGTINNLAKGASKRFRKNDPRAKINSNPWGKQGAPRP